MTSALAHLVAAWAAVGLLVNVSVLVGEVVRKKPVPKIADFAFGCVVWPLLLYELSQS